MFLLRTGESLDIEIDSFNRSLKLLLSRHRINRDHGYPVTMMTNNLKHLYRKAIFSGAFTHYESYFSQSYKKSLIGTLLFRCFLICSDYILFHLKVENLRETLKKNNYASGIKEQPIKCFSEKSNSNCSQKRTFYNTSLSLSYVIQFKARIHASPISICACARENET